MRHDNRLYFIGSVFLIASALLLQSLSAEEIILNNGTSLEGAILERTDSYCKVNVSGVPIKYAYDEIKSMGIKINPLVELDFMTRQQIYALRKRYVQQQPQVSMVRSYTPSGAVFGQIEDKKPWWGIMGLSHIGAGKQSIMGLSEESRFIANPFLLVAVGEAYAFTVHGRKPPSSGVYPKPVRLLWQLDDTFARVRYDIKSYWRMAKRYYDNKYLYDFELVAYNARDLGFQYMYIVPEKSKNVTYRSALVELKQFIHCGGSCGYPGGCNNHSPHQAELDIKIQGVPASLFIKLWRRKPRSHSQKADMVFVIEMI